MARFGQVTEALTMTRKVQVLVPPKPSRMVTVTRLVPTGKVEPLGGVDEALVMVQPFTGGRDQVTLLLVVWPGSVVVEMSAGQAKLRETVSTIMLAMARPLAVSPARRMVSEEGEEGSDKVVICVRHAPG